MTVDLFGSAAKELKVWAHKVTARGDSEALPAHVETVNALRRVRST